MADRPNGQAPLRAFTFDNLRSRSHIFYRLFSQHPQVTQHYHPFMTALFLGPERIQVHFKHSEIRRKEITETWAPKYVDETFDIARRQLERDVGEIEKTERSIWSNEHCGFVLKQDIALNIIRGRQYKPEELAPNPTQLPNWLFLTLSPILVIRHPALVVPSLHIALSATSTVSPEDEDFRFLSTLGYSRVLFDLFRHLGKDPIVVDGDDVVWRTKDMTTNVCKALGISPEGVAKEWEPTPEDHRPTNPIVAGFTKTMHESHGVERPADTSLEPVSVDAEVEKWTARFGEKVAWQLKTHVNDIMPDYEYLVQFKV